MNTLDKDAVSAMVCEALNCEKNIWEKSRKADVCLARQIVWWLFWKSGYGHSEMAKIFEWNRVTMLHGTNLIQSYVERYHDFSKLCMGLNERLHQAA